jgi:transcriptional regulator with XRE-family HTH domain
MSFVVSTPIGMSPRRLDPEPSASVGAVAARLAVELGSAIRSERMRRHWSLARLARESGLSVSRVQSAEAAIAASLETYARLTVALSLRPEFVITDPRRRSLASEDPVHSAMAEVQAAHFRSLGFEVAIDEPYKHYQFAGRADFLAWDVASRALLHHENRTRFPNVQDVAGAFNQKRVYLAQAIADRLGIKGGFHSVTHVMVTLWSAEVIHSFRIRTETFRTLCPDPVDRFADWWAGKPPAFGLHRTLVIFDPAPATPRRPTFRGLEPIDTLRPRYAGYREAVEALEAAGRA